MTRLGTITPSVGELLFIGNVSSGPGTQLSQATIAASRVVSAWEIFVRHPI